MASTLFLCDGAEAPPDWARQSWDVETRLNHTGSEPEVNLRIENLSHALLAQLSPRQADLVRIAAYVYIADQSVSRGGEADVYGRDWRRRMALCIPVSQPELWRDSAVFGALMEILHFLSGDLWELHFTPSRNEEEQLIFSLSERELHGNPDCVILFSAGADSLCAMVDAITTGRKSVLVSHRPTPLVESRQKGLVSELRRRVDPWGLPQIGAVVHRRGLEAKEASQRTRSFLYASVGAVVASRLGISDVPIMAS